MLWKWLEPNDDFQDLPSWRELVIATAVSLRKHHADTLIVPMSLIRDAYRAEILGGLADAGQEVFHVFLDADPAVLHERLRTRVRIPNEQEWEEPDPRLGSHTHRCGCRRRDPTAERDSDIAFGQDDRCRTCRRSPCCSALGPRLLEFDQGDT